MAEKVSQKETVKPQWSFKEYILWCCGLIGAGLLVVAVLFLLGSLAACDSLTSFELLESPDTNLASEVISSDCKTLGKYYFEENRTPVDFDELPDHLVNALIATEDERYYEHSGIDAWGTLRAVVFLGQRGGASTISQQLAKQLFTDKVSSNIAERIIQKRSEEHTSE